MSYTITKTNGTTLGTILDGTINTSFTSLTLIGRNYANYGEIIANDLVALLENFAYSSEPANPLAGQLYWNTTDKRLRVYTGTAFKIVSSCTAQTTAPTTTVAGDLWWDTTYSQLYIYNGTDPYSAAGWILVGPQRDGSGAVWEQITDNASIVHDVLSIKLNNARTSIISRDSEFTPANAIAGYTTIKAGINANTSVGSATFHGLANNSSFLGGQPAASYLRNDIDATTTGNLTIAKNGGLTIGLSSNLQITTTTAGGASIKATKTNQDIDFFANISGTNTNVLNLDGATGLATLISANISGALTVGGAATVTGALAVTGTGAFTGNLTAPTQLAGTADTTVATTAFVVNNSGFLKNKIYSGTTSPLADTYIEVNTAAGGNSANVIITVGGGTPVATASNIGFNLALGATAITQEPVLRGNIAAGNIAITGNSYVATTSYVRQAAEFWGGSKKFISTDAPSLGVNDIGSINGDFWFQREA
jgi:hypothetical protein